jgi:erythromycin esterase-like protein
MWRNREVVRFLRWLRGHNADRKLSERVGFYGLDLYSLHSSISCVIEYLDKVHPEAGQLARQRYGCFDIFREDLQTYGYATSARMAGSCEDDVVRQLIDLQRRAAEYAQRDGRIASDEYFVAERNARVVKDVEAYAAASLDRGTKVDAA